MAKHLVNYRLLFVISEDWYFVSHRLDLAKIAIKAGYSVALLSHYTKHRKEIENAGIEMEVKQSLIWLHSIR